MAKSLSIFLGILIIYLASFVLIWLFSTLYFKISKRGSRGLKKNLFHSSILALINLVVILLVVGVFSINKYVFTSLSFLVFSLSYFLFYRYAWKLEKLDAVILALGMAFILNP